MHWLGQRPQDGDRYRYHVSTSNENPETIINGQIVDLNDVVTGDVNVGAIACEPQT